ncbi:MAG: hypothetical protein ACK4SJ_05905 [Sphingorhabdus sp.]
MERMDLPQLLFWLDRAHEVNADEEG